MLTRWTDPPGWSTSRVNDYLAAVSTERFRHAAPGHRARSEAAVRAIPPPTAGSSDSAGAWGTGRRVRWRGAHRRRLSRAANATYGPRGSWRSALPARPVRRIGGSQTGRGGTHHGACRLRRRKGFASPTGNADRILVVRRSEMPAGLTASSASTGLVPEEGSSGLPDAQPSRWLTGGTVGVNHARGQAAQRGPPRRPRRVSARWGSRHAPCQSVRGCGHRDRAAQRRSRHTVLPNRGRWVRAMALLSSRSSARGREPAAALLCGFNGAPRMAW